MICSSKPQPRQLNNWLKIHALSVDRSGWWEFSTPGTQPGLSSHIHYLVPAGGLAPNGGTWLPARQNFLLPVRALSKIFRGKLHQLYEIRVVMPTSGKSMEAGVVVHCEPVGTGLALEVSGALYFSSGHQQQPYLEVGK